MMEMSSLTFLMIFLPFLSNSQQIKYLNGLVENESCEIGASIYGTCRIITECLREYEFYRKNQTKLMICNFGSKLSNSVICCPRGSENSDINRISAHVNRGRVFPLPKLKKDLFDFETCRHELLKYRNQSINPNHFAEAMLKKIIPTNKDNCDTLKRLNLQNNNMVHNLDLLHYSCVRADDGSYSVTVVGALYAILVEKGDRPNMAAIGWTQRDMKIVYKCGGSVVTDRFIVTAAHCKFHEGVQPDTVRLGDRYLITEEDDEYAQQLKIQSFILHPDYKSSLHYNDIAMIKTVEKIIFNKFVVPSCIGNLDAERVGHFTDWTVAGYGETEDGVPSNVLLELKVDLVPTSECNKTYKNDLKLPNGIIDSQLCVKSKKIGGNIPDTCFGDSGSPLQFKSSHEVFHNDYNTSYLSTVYQTSTVLGIVSFGISCGFDVPSVYTKLDYYRDWMRSVTQSY